MNLLFTLIIGAAVGWLATIAADKPDKLIPNVTFSLIGALLGYISSLLFVANDVFLFSWLTLYWSLAGAVILTTIINLFKIYPHRKIK